MARIPLGNFGSAQPARAPQVRIADTSAANRAMQDLAGAGVQLGLTMQAEALREQRDEQQKQTAAAEAARRANDTLALQTAHEGLLDLAAEMDEGVQRGDVPKDKAREEWAKRSGEITSKALESVSAESKTIAQAKLSGLGGRLNRSIDKAIEKRNRQEVTASFDGILENASRGYGRDPAAMQALVNNAAQSLGPQSLYSPEQIQRKVQIWGEQSQRNSALTTLAAVERDAKGLQTLAASIKDPEQYAMLTPEARLDLSNRVADAQFRLQREADAARERALREQAARLQRAEASFTAAQGMALAGVLSDEYRQRVMNEVAGTPFATAFAQLVQTQREAGAFAQQPLVVQQATVDSLRARFTTNASPELKKQLDQAEAVLRRTNADVQEDALGAFAQRTGETVRPLNFAGGLQGLPQQMAARVAQAGRAKSFAGRAVSPLLPGEVDTFAQMLNNVPEGQFGAFVATMAQVVPPDQVQAIARQIDPKNKALALALAAGADTTTHGRTVAELMRTGARVMADAKERPGGKGDMVRQQNRARVLEYLDGEDGRSGALTGEARSNVAEAAMLILEARAAGGERFKAEEAVNLALGGRVIERNGVRLPVRGSDMDESEFTRRLQQYPQAAIAAQAKDGKVYLRDKAVSLDVFAEALPSADLVPAGAGRYMVRMGGVLAVNERGQRIVIEVGR